MLYLSHQLNSTSTISLGHVANPYSMWPPMRQLTATMRAAVTMRAEYGIFQTLSPSSSISSLATFYFSGDIDVAPDRRDLPAFIAEQTFTFQLTLPGPSLIADAVKFLLSEKRFYIKHSESNGSHYILANLSKREMDSLIYNTNPTKLLAFQVCFLLFCPLLPPLIIT